MADIKRDEGEALAFGEFEVNLYKLLLPGYVTAEHGDGQRRPIHIRIRIGPDTLNKHKDGWFRPHFSGMGVVGAKSNGDCWGSSCQCEDSIRDLADDNQIEYCKGWDKAALIRLLEVWDKWHLNGTRAGCEHQRENWNTRERIEVITWRQTMEAYRYREALEESAVKAAREGNAANFTDAERELRSLPWEIVWPDAPKELPAFAGEGTWQAYKIEKRQESYVGQVYATQHPQGCLSKPCEVCGYKYGSAWLYEAIPADVIEYVRSLPDAVEGCAWGSL